MPVCDHCEAPARELYLLPRERVGVVDTGAVCRFCFLRIVGIAPRRTALVGRTPVG